MIELIQQKLVSRSPTVISAVAVWFLLLTGVLVFSTLDWVENPGKYTQISWLTNYEHGFVRRGFSGQIVMYASDATGLSQLRVVWLLEHLSSIGTFVLLFLAIRRTKVNLVTALLLISPATLLFTVNDTRGGFGREDAILVVLMLSYLLMLGECALLRAIPLLLFGLGAIGLVLAHEVTVFFAPLFFLMYLVHLGRINGRFHLATSAVIPVSMAVTFLIVVAWGLPADDYQSRFCQSLRDIGLEEKYCDGFASWPSDWRTNISRTSTAFFGNRYYIGYPLALLASLAPFGLILVSRNGIPKLNSNRLIVIVLGISVIAMIPLFVLALDWGRWIYMYLMGLMIAWLASSRARYALQVRRDWRVYATVYTAAIVLSSFSWGMSHCCDYGVSVGGFFTNLSR